jgi:O-antigen/teichoic acid export membrane protein
VTERPQPVPAPLPNRPYRYSLLINLGLAAALFAFAWLASGRIVDAVIYATFYFVVALSWTWFRLRRRIVKGRE